MFCVMLYVPGTGMVFTAVVTPNTCDYSATVLLRLLLTLVMMLCIGPALYLLLLSSCCSWCSCCCSVLLICYKNHKIMSDEVVIQKGLHFVRYWLYYIPKVKARNIYRVRIKLKAKNESDD